MKSTCDISDQLHPHVQYLDPIFKSYGVKTAFSGRIVTIKCFEDNSLVEEALNMNGKGCVLVVDAGESLRCAMLGDKRALDAIKNPEDPTCLFPRSWDWGAVSRLLLSGEPSYAPHGGANALYKT